MDNQVVENVIVIEALPAETENGTSVTTKSPSSSAGRFSVIYNLAARRPMASLHSLWTNYYPGRAIGEDLIIPGSTLKFVIAGLLGFAEIKSQGKTGFPFETHPQAVMVAVSSLLMYGFASAAEHILSATLIVDYALIARLGRMVSLYMLVGSLATLFYF